MRVLLVFATCLFFSFKLHSQCTPQAATGNPGVTPSPDSIPCIEKGVFYDFTVYTENFSSFTTPIGSVAVNYTRIDSVTNLPCGLTWQSDKLQYNAGETGCIRVSGTSHDSVGQYRLGQYITMEVNIPLVGVQTFSGEINSLITQLESFVGSLGYNFAYFSRVIDPGNSCPPLDTSASAINLTSSGINCPGFLAVSISGNTTICAGQSTTLTANATNATGAVTYSWSNGGTTQSINVTTANSYSVTATDQNGNATASASVSVNPKPTAAFTVNATVLSVAVTNTSTGGASYSWNFGDGQTSTVQNPPAHTYASDGNYNITLIVTSAASCNDTATQNVSVGCPLPTAEFSASASGLDVTFSNTSTGATSYLWDFGDGDTSSAASPASHTFASDGSYTITLIATNSCGSDTTSENVTVTGVFVNSVEYDLGFDVFPNPSTGMTSILFFAEFPGENYELTVMDLAGKKVFEEKFTNDQRNGKKQLDLSQLSKGTYNIKLRSGEVFGVKKIVLR